MDIDIKKKPTDTGKRTNTGFAKLILSFSLHTET